jgi:DNA-binding beta-propeller fold protein YncE
MVTLTARRGGDVSCAGLDYGLRAQFRRRDGQPDHHHDQSGGRRDKGRQRSGRHGDHAERRHWLRGQRRRWDGHPDYHRDGHRRPGHRRQRPRCIAITPDGKTAYVASTGSGTVTPITTATSKVSPPITTTATPVTPVNLVTDTAGEPYRSGVPGSGSVNGLSVSPDGTTVWTTVSGNNVNSVAALSTAGNAEAGVGPLPSHGINVAVSPDGTTAYVI